MREPRETKIDRLRGELVRAKEKAGEWQVRARDIERQITELENLEIVRAVRDITAAPEDLRSVLDMIRANIVPPETKLRDEE